MVTTRWVGAVIIGAVLGAVTIYALEVPRIHVVTGLPQGCVSPPTNINPGSLLYYLATAESDLCGSPSPMNLDNATKALIEAERIVKSPTHPYGQPMPELVLIQNALASILLVQQNPPDPTDLTDARTSTGEAVYVASGPPPYHGRAT